MTRRDILGEFEHLVLLAVLRQEPDGYGATIRREIEERAGRRVSVGALYSTLDRLAAKGMVSARTGHPTPERGGRAKRHFEVTPAGHRALRESRRQLEAMWEGLSEGR